MAVSFREGNDFGSPLYSNSWAIETSTAKSLAATVDGRNPANQLRLVVYPIIYKVLAPSPVVVWDFFHQQTTEHINTLVGWVI